MILAPSINEIWTEFHNYVKSQNGDLLNCYQDESTLFARGHNFVNLAGEVARRDEVNGGVAIRVVDEQVSVYSFTFRQVCQNGAIVPNVVFSRRVLRLPESEFSDFSKIECLNDIRELIVTCASPAAFAQNVKTMRELTRKSNIESMLSIDSTLRNVLEHLTPEIRQLVLQEYLEKEEPSLYGIMNAITAVAREQNNPQTKWDLEELGGGIGARLLPILGPDFSAANLQPT